MNKPFFTRCRLAALAAAALTVLSPAFAWEPTKTVEFLSLIHI